jgi:Kdo2-lipid IVA lauroyltransferase/acyltransferase
VKQRLETWAAAIVSFVLRGLPRGAALGLGAALGRLVAAADPRHVAIAVDNLRHAFPEWDEARLEATARAVYAHFGRMLFDILWLQWRSREELLALVEVHGREHVEAAMATGRGVVMCAAHIGNWEVHGIAHGLLFGAIDVVARPLDNLSLDARLCAFRTMGGNRVVYKRKALAQVLGAIRAGRGVALLLDQNVQAKDGIFVDFFGRPAATTTVAAALALKTGCALVPSHTELRPDGRYALVYEPPLVWASGGARDTDLASITQELARRTEAWVRATPQQWLWMHRRWKTQPERPA